jgi:hypothetical protein
MASSSDTPSALNGFGQNTYGGGGRGGWFSTTLGQDGKSGAVIIAINFTP